MNTMTPKLKTFMNDLWDAGGNTVVRPVAETVWIDTPLGRGWIVNVRTKAGIDLEVMVAIPDIDGFTLFNGMELFDMEAGRA